jgi:hypothetical protein
MLPSLSPLLVQKLQFTTSRKGLGKYDKPPMPKGMGVHPDVKGGLGLSCEQQLFTCVSKE